MRVKVLGTRPAPNPLREMFSRVVRGHAPIVSVRRRELSYWQERGWVRDGNHYTGSYQTPHASFHGWIEEKLFGNIEFLLHNPSPEIRSHSHWVCFAARGDEWYLVHMARRPKDVSSGILTIERLISEAFE